MGRSEETRFIGDEPVADSDSTAGRLRRRPEEAAKVSAAELERAIGSRPDARGRTTLLSLATLQVKE